MSAIKVSSEQLNAVWNLPACIGRLRYDDAAGKPSFCASGKVYVLMGITSDDAMMQIHHHDRVAVELKLDPDVRINNYDEHGCYPKDLLTVSMTPIPFGPEHKQWDRHILAFKRILQKFIAAGYIELEDKAAAEFAQLTQSEQVAA